MAAGGRVRGWVGGRQTSRSRPWAPLGPKESFTPGPHSIGYAVHIHLSLSEDHHFLWSSRNVMASRGWGGRNKPGELREGREHFCAPDRGRGAWAREPASLVSNPGFPLTRCVSSGGLHGHLCLSFLPWETGMVTASLSPVGGELRMGLLGARERSGSAAHKLWDWRLGSSQGAW